MQAIERKSNMLSTVKRSVAVIGILTAAALTMAGAASAKDISGTFGPNLLKGTASSDRIWGHGGNDKIYGYNGNDQLIGGNGEDWISGGTHTDKLWGENGDDTLMGSVQPDGYVDTLYCGLGYDVAIVEPGIDRVTWSHCNVVKDYLGRRLYQ